MLTEPREALLRTSTYKVAAGKPATIDLTTIHQGDNSPLVAKGMDCDDGDLFQTMVQQSDNITLHTKGIYSITGDVLTYCIAAPGLPRPTEATTGKWGGYTFVVLKRVP